MKKSELRQIIREEIDKTLNQSNEMYVIYIQREGEDKKIRMYTVPRNKAMTVFNNTGYRYSDGDIRVGLMSLDQWKNVPDSEKDLEREN